MADITKTFNTRILNKVDTLENWNKSTLPLLKGEIAIATVAATAGTGLTEPVCMLKIGEDGVKTFSQLEFNFYAKASDVLAACKSEASLKTFINNVITDAKLATSAEMEELAGRVTDAEGAIETLNGDVDTAGSVAKAIKDAIDALDLANTYAAKEHEHVAEDITDFADAVKVVKVDEAASADKATSDGNGNVIADTYALKEHEHVAEDITDFADAVKVVKVDEAVKADEATKATQDGNGDEIAATYFKKADVATTNVSAFINDAKYQKDTEVQAAIQAAIAEINHAVFEKVDAVPAPADAASNVLYLVPEGDKLNIYAKINDEMVLIDDTDADLSGYALKSELHEHANKDLLDTYTQTEENLADAVAKKHEHTFVDTDVEDAITKKHAHENATVLDGITAEKVAAWDAAEQNAKDYADGLADDYATAEQGAKADTALQEVTTTENGGLKVTKAEGSTSVNIDFDENVTFIFDCGGSGVVAE